MGMRVVVTGACGRLGAPLCRRMAQAGFDVTAADLRPAARLPVPVRAVNLLDPVGCYALVEGAEAVVHLANYPGMTLRDPQRIYNENTAMDMNVFQAACEQGVRKLVFASSIQAVCGSRTRDQLDRPSILSYLPLDHETPARPGNAYGLSKAAGEGMLEFFARTAGVQGVALRFPWIAAPADAGDWQARHGERLPALVDEGLSYILAEDAVRLVEAVLRAELPGFRTYLPAAPDTVNGWVPARAVRELYAGVPLHCPAEELEGLVDNTRLTADTGWRPRRARDLAPPA